MDVVIMAGGKGTRIASVNSLVPKPMIEVAGKPVLVHQIECLKRQGFKDITLVIGHLGNIIKDRLGDGKALGVNIRYIEEKDPLGTAGALYYLRGKMCENFLLLNGDIIFDVDIARFARAHEKYGGLATVLTHPNDHPYDSGLITADHTGRVTEWLHKEDTRGWHVNRVNAGLHMISPGLLDRITELKKTDLDRDLLRPLIAEGKLYAYDSPEYVKDMGTPERLVEVERDIVSGKVHARNLSEKQKAIFLDRDGTINEYVGFLTDIDDFNLCDGAAEAISEINKSGMLAIVVTNQPVIARGEVTREQLDLIHAKMETLLGEKGAYIDGLYYCPHHPHKGYEGEIPELKFDCDCRKPKPGLLIRASHDFNIDLASSWMVGDGENDIECGKRAGCHTAKIGEPDSSADVCGKSLLDCVRVILDK